MTTNKVLSPSWNLRCFKDFLTKYTSSDVSAARKEQLKLAFDLQKFGLPEHQPVCDEYTRGALLIDVVQDSVDFALREGFSCSELYHFLTIYIHTLTTMAGQSCSGQDGLSTVTDEFKKTVLEHTGKFIQDHLLCTVSYTRDTVFRHYRLYQYLLKEEQPLDLTTVKLEAPQPVSVQGLRDAVQEQEWTKSQQMAELESKQQKEKEDFMEACELAVRDEEAKLQSVYESELGRLGEQMTEGDVGRLVESLAAAHLQSMKLALEHSIQTQTMELEMKTEKLELLSPKHALNKEE